MRAFFIPQRQSESTGNVLSKKLIFLSIWNETRDEFGQLLEQYTRRIVRERILTSPCRCPHFQNTIVYVHDMLFYSHSCATFSLASMFSACILYTRLSTLDLDSDNLKILTFLLIFIFLFQSQSIRFKPNVRRLQSTDKKNSEIKL